MKLENTFMRATFKIKDPIITWNTIVFIRKFLQNTYFSFRVDSPKLHPIQSLGDLNKIQKA